MNTNNTIINQNLLSTYASYIDHTILKPDATEDAVIAICQEALLYKFHSVCVNSSHTSCVAQQLLHSPVQVCVVVGFPLGACLTHTKVAETAEAISRGAQEIDMVINVGLVKSQQWDALEHDIRSVYTACNGIPLKVILETCLLTDDEKVHICEICRDINVAFVKTSTGFSTGGATIHDVQLLRTVVGHNIGVKASGGIRSFETAHAMIEAGANRLGTSSGIAIVTGKSHENAVY